MNIPSKFLVCVRCFTYNHAPFIVDTMNGFIMQKTEFPFVCTIVDDASPDGEATIITQYLAQHFDLDDTTIVRREETDDFRLVFARHLENINCYFAVILLKYNHQSIQKKKMPYIAEWYLNAKYHAPCEGDDYWIDEKKLQKQVSFLESNPDYSLCFHSVNECFEGRPRLNHVRTIVEDREYSGIEWYKNRPSQFASFVFRTSILNTELYKRFLHDSGFIVGDVPLLLICAHYGKLRGMSSVMSVYRHNETGWTQKKRDKASIIRIAESELHYAVFGEEFKSQGESFYCLALVRAFFNTVVTRGNPMDFEYLRLAWQKSKSKTVISFFVLIKKLIKKYLKV